MIASLGKRHEEKAARAGRRSSLKTRVVRVRGRLGVCMGLSEIDGRVPLGLGVRCAVVQCFGDFDSGMLIGVDTWKYVVFREAVRKG